MNKAFNWIAISTNGKTLLDNYILIIESFYKRQNSDLVFLSKNSTIFPFLLPLGYYAKIGNRLSYSPDVRAINKRPKVPITVTYAIPFKFVNVYEFGMKLYTYQSITTSLLLQHTV